MQDDIGLGHEFAAPYDVRRCGTVSDDSGLQHARSGPLILTHARVEAIDAFNEPDTRTKLFARLDLKYVRHGEVVVAVDGQRFTVGAGEMVLLDHESPFSIHIAQDTDCLCVVMPKYWLVRQNPLCEGAMFKTITPDQPFVATMGSFLEEWRVARQGPVHLIGVQFGGLLSLITAAIQSGEARLSSRLADTIITTIREQSGNPLLNVDEVAGNLRISRRHLYATLAKIGTTFGQELMAARLEASHLLLANPEYDSLQIGEIAYLSGFQDQAHFNRRFRSRYGLTPGEIRQRPLDRVATVHHET